MRALAIILSITFLIACSTKKKIATTPVATIFTDADLARATAKFPGTTADHLTTGKTLYEGNCASCHALKVVGDYTEEKWREINPVMVKKANKFKSANLDAEAEQAILKYVVVMAKK